MPTLPTYRQQVIPNSTGMQPRASAGNAGAGLSSLAQGVQGIVEGVERADRAFLQKQEDDARAWVAGALSSDHVKWLARQKELESNASPGAPNFTREFLREYDDNTFDSLKGAPNEDARKFYAERRAVLRTSLAGSALDFEARSAIQWRMNQAAEARDNVSKLAVIDPDQAKVAWEEQRRLLGDSAVGIELRRKLDAQVAKAGALGMVERDPRAALALLDKRIGIGKPGEATGNLFVDGLDAQTLVTLQNRAQVLVAQIERRAEADAEKREKLADRAIAGATRQIEAAVPLSVDAWNDLRAKVAGTSRAGEFNALVTQERETQKVLRMPLPQQEQYLRQREAKLAQQGGTMADKGNLQRIRTAIDTNRRELEQAPLVAAQRLYGKQVQPLDIVDLVAPGGAQRAAALFADRAVTLQAMAKQFGLPVGEKPLLPQEKDILVQALDKASSEQATNLFGSLRAAIDDDETYRAALQQMAPDSPVKARAGVLAAAGKSITLEHNLIADDRRIPSERVARTILTGEQIVNKTERQRAEDGKSASLFVPSREAFATAFADKVKNLYRGRPGAQDADLQTAFAYYVGKAAELGQAADGSNIDSKLASEAVTATLGALVDFNGRGTVKAPLGMTADDFKSRMSEKFAELVKDEKLPVSVLGFFSHYGAVNYRRDGTYVLTLGEAPVVNPKTGQPVVIDLAPVPFSGSPYRSTADLIPGQPGRQGQGGSR